MKLLAALTLLALIALLTLMASGEPQWNETRDVKTECKDFFTW